MLTFKDSVVILVSRSHVPFWPLFTHFLHILCWHKEPKTFFTPQLSDRKIHLFCGFVLSALCNHVEHKLIASTMWKWQEAIRWFYGPQECSSSTGSVWIFEEHIPKFTSVSDFSTLCSQELFLDKESALFFFFFFSFLPSCLFILKHILADTGLWKGQGCS